MKTFDIKSLVLGLALGLLVLSVTASRNQETNDHLEVIAGHNKYIVFNKETMTIYGYSMYLNLHPKEEPDFKVKLSPDGSRISYN